jgi:tetratricopeptide (TPR) repeat protein
MKTADANLALLLLEQSDPASARDALERAIAEGVRVLDIPRLGRDYNNLAIACQRMNDLGAARDAFIEAIRYHTAGGQRGLLAGNYRNLGLCLAQLGELETGLAALEHGAELATDLGTINHEFEILADLLGVCIENRTRLDVIPQVLRRCQEIMDGASDRLSRDSLLQFGHAMQEIVQERQVTSLDAARTVYRVPQVSSPEGRKDLGKLIPTERSCNFEEVLRQRLGRGIPGRLVPKVDELRQFLMMFTGDFFKSANYTGEFGMTQERAKRHFRWMCSERVLERYGTRKASRYALAFHRN